MNQNHGSRLRARLTLTVEGDFADASAEGVAATLARRVEQREDGDHLHLLRVEDVEVLERSMETPRPAEAAASFFDARTSLDVLAAQQNVRPVEDFEKLLGDFWPDDESADDFVAAVREWRHGRE